MCFQFYERKMAPVQLSGVPAFNFGYRLKITPATKFYDMAITSDSARLGVSFQAEKDDYVRLHGGNSLL